LSSHNEIMDFDLLVGQAAPFLGFGEVVQDSTEHERELHKNADQVRKQIRNTFGAKLDNSSTTPKELDDIAQELWETGWDPRVGNVALFTRDFGLLLTEATMDLLGGRMVCRSTTNLIHWSIFWANQRVEAFPFHKALKCLTYSEGETMTYFVRGLASQLEERGPLKPDVRERLPKARFPPKSE
jgi:hypothetical protein